MLTKRNDQTKQTYCFILRDFRENTILIKKGKKYKLKIGLFHIYRHIFFLF